MYHAVPPKFDARLIEIVDDCLGRFHRLQLVFLTGGTRIAFCHDPVEFIEYLHVGIYRKLAPSQPQQDTSLTGTDLTGALVTGSTADQRHVTPFFVILELFHQTGLALRKCMVEGPAKLLA